MGLIDEKLENWRVGDPAPDYEIWWKGPPANLWHLCNDHAWHKGGWVVNHFGHGQWRCGWCFKNPPQEIIDCCDLLGIGSRHD